ncbi:MAG: hypothetical protein ACT4NL_11600 [Pseudomarimonas sp.]
MLSRRTLVAITTSALVAAANLTMATASADEGSTLDSIEVTGTRISYRDLLEGPTLSRSSLSHKPQRSSPR